MSFVTSPIDLVKSRLQTQYHHKLKQFSGPIHCLVQAYQSKGMKGIYQGWTAQFLREISGYSVYFTTFELLKYWMKNQNQNNLTHFHLFLSGGLSGLAFWVILNNL